MPSYAPRRLRSDHVADGVHISVIRERECRFIAASDGRAGFMCGRPAEKGTSWCPDHAFVVWQRPPPTQHRTVE